MKLKYLIQAPEGDVDGTGGPQTPIVPDTTTDTSVGKEKTDDKSIGGIKFYKEQLENERKERERISAELEEIRTNKLKEQNQWKDLYEREQQKAAELGKKLTSISTTLVEDKMKAAIEKEAAAAGILPSALEDLDLVDRSMIEIETTSQGRVNFHNVKEFVDSLKIKKPHWFGSRQEPNINNRKGDYTPSSDLNAEQILELQTKDPARYNDIMNKRLGRK